MRKGHIGKVIKVILLVMSVALASFVLFIAAKLYKLDAWDNFDPERILGAPNTLILYDAEDKEITRLHGTEDRVNISLSELPAYVPQAFIAVEDARFYEHKGLDIIRIFGAIWEDIKAGEYVQGASTISQQLVKLSHLSNDKTISRKLEEAVLAFQMERRFSKDEILEMYLNYVYFGGGYYGIEAASLGYFGIPAKELSVAQAAQLAGILKSPSNYAPHLNPEASVQRRNLVLTLMHRYGYIDEAQMLEAQAYKPVIVHKESRVRRGYYVDAALKEASALLGVDMTTLLTGGFRIYTAMDRELQNYCEALFEEDTLFPAEGCEGAVVVKDSHSGLVRAMVGGRKYSGAMSFNRAMDIRRQPGSVIKPIIAYAPALEHGYTAASMILDEKTSFNGYTPSNFNNKYHGWVTLRRAVSSSLNIPAVKVLDEIGVDTGIAFAQKLGIEFDENDRHLALALGGFTYGVSPWQIAGAYGAFAAGGVYYQPTVIRSITDREGNVLYAYSMEGEQVMCAQNAYVLTSMLKSVIEVGTGSKLADLGIPLAGKTGTVGEIGGNRDAWMAVYNSEYTAAVWMGYDSTQSGVLPEEATGGKYPAALLSRIYSYIYADGREAPGFIPPQGVQVYKLDKYTLETMHEAVLANALTPESSVISEIFVEGTQPQQTSTYWTVPLPVSDFSVSLDADGTPVISFATRQSHVLYRLYRTDGYSRSLVGEWNGKTRRVTYRDTAAPNGSCTYYVVPVHPELVIGGRNIIGPESKRLSVNVLKTIIVPPTIDLTDISNQKVS